MLGAFTGGCSGSGHRKNQINALSSTVPVQSDWLNSALSPVVYGDIALSINT